MPSWISRREADFETVDLDDGLREQLHLDSMDFLNFVIALHETMGIEIPEADYPRLFTLDLDQWTGELIGPYFILSVSRRRTKGWVKGTGIGTVVA